MSDYVWHFSSRSYNNKTAMVAILTHGMEPVYVYALPPKYLKVKDAFTGKKSIMVSSDPFLGLDQLVMVASRYLKQHKLGESGPPTWPSREVAVWMRDPMLVSGADGKQKRSRYELAVQARKLIPSTENSSLSEAPAFVQHLFVQYAKKAIVSQSVVNQGLRIAEVAQAQVRREEFLATKHEKIAELKERIAKGESKQLEWIQMNGGENQSYTSLLLKLRTELEKLEPPTYVLTSDDDDKYAWAWGLLEQGESLGAYDSRQLGRAMKKDSRLDAWMADRVRNAPKERRERPVNLLDIADIFGGKVVQTRESPRELSEDETCVSKNII